MQAMAPWVASINDLDEHLLSKVLHAAAAPLRQGVGGAAVVVKQWTNLALVCRRWGLCSGMQQAEKLCAGQTVAGPQVWRVAESVKCWLAMALSISAQGKCHLSMVTAAPSSFGGTAPAFLWQHVPSVTVAWSAHRWRQQMLAEPVAVAVRLDRWPAVRAWLSNTHVPLTSLQLTAADGRAAQQACLHY